VEQRTRLLNPHRFGEAELLQDLSELGHETVRGVGRDFDRELQPDLQLRTRAELRKDFGAETVSHFRGDNAHEAQCPC
jgi:hypothetical protein